MQVAPPPRSRHAQTFKDYFLIELNLKKLSKSFSRVTNVSFYQSAGFIWKLLVYAATLTLSDFVHRKRLRCDDTRM